MVWRGGGSSQRRRGRSATSRESPAPARVGGFLPLIDSPSAARVPMSPPVMGRRSAAVEAEGEFGDVESTFAAFSELNPGSWLPPI